MKNKILALSFLVNSACGYDGSIGRIKKDLENEPEKTETKTEATTETVEPETVEVEPVENETENNEYWVDDFGCRDLTDKFFTVKIDDRSELTVKFENNGGSAFIRNFKRVIGGHIGNDTEQVLFAESEGNEVSIVRDSGFIRWFIDDKQVGYISIYGIRQTGNVSVCKMEFFI